MRNFVLELIRRWRGLPIQDQTNTPTHTPSPEVAPTRAEERADKVGKFLGRRLQYLGDEIRRLEADRAQRLEEYISGGKHVR